MHTLYILYICYTYYINTVIIIISTNSSIVLNQSGFLGMPCMLSTQMIMTIVSGFMVKLQYVLQYLSSDSLPTFVFFTTSVWSGALNISAFYVRNIFHSPLNPFPFHLNHQKIWSLKKAVCVSVYLMTRNAPAERVYSL